MPDSHAGPLPPDPPPPGALAWQYGFAVAAVSIALAIGLAAERVAPFVGAYSPYVLFAAAIMVTAVRGGFRPGLLATVLSGLATAFFHLHPLYSPNIEDQGEVVLLALFLLEGTVLSAVASALATGDHVGGTVATRYAAAVGAVIGAVFIKVALASLLPQTMPFMLFYACVLFGAWYGGPGPGLVAAAVAAGSASFFFFEPRYSLRVGDPERAGQLIAFLFEAGLISLFSRTIELMRDRAGLSELAARRYWEELRTSEHRLRRQNQVLSDLARKPEDVADPDHAIRDLAESAATTIDVERASIWVFDASRTVLRCLDLFERSVGKHSQGAELRVEDYPGYFRAIDENRSVAALDAQTDGRTCELAASYLVPLGITSMLDAPIRVSGAVVGVVCLEHMGLPRRWAIEEEQFVGSIGDFVALVLKRRELRAAEAKLLRAQRLESIGSLAGGIAHDLNNLLTPVLMGAELLRDVTAPDQQAPLLELIRTSAERGGALLRQILTFARGSTTPSGSVEIAPVIAQVANLLRHTIGSGIGLVVEIPDFVRPVRGTPTHLDQVLMNLCVNARDAMPGGGRLVITVRNRELLAGTSEVLPDGTPGTYVAVSVSDTGTGIPPDVLDRIFDPFFTTKEPGRGTGLGLATTRDIVKGLGGFIRVQSLIGKGTTFTVYLPSADDAPPVQPGSGDAPSSKGELVLVADDEASIRELARRLLEAYGYRVVTASDGAEAVARCRERAKELRAVLLNMTMPGQPLDATLALLQKEFPALPVVLTSGFYSGRSEDGPGLGEAAFLTKPYTGPQLLQAMAKAIHPPAK